MNEKNSFIVLFDRDIQFIFHFWQKLCEKKNIKSKLFIAWYSKIDDQIENANADFKIYLKIYVNYNQNDWMNFLSFVEFKINSIKNNSIELKFFLITQNYFFKSKLKFSKFITKNAKTKKIWEKQTNSSIKLKWSKFIFEMNCVKFKLCKKNTQIEINILFQN